MRWYWWALLALALSGGGVVVYNQTRGLRNNNPGNIEKGQPWYGLAPEQPDSRFATFTKPEYGIRALGKLLLNYERLYNINTVAGIINRWAPGHENPTDAYVQFVARAAGVQPSARISVREKLPQLVRAIIQFENGIQPYPDEVINAGLAMV